MIKIEEREACGHVVGTINSIDILAVGSDRELSHFISNIAKHEGWHFYFYFILFFGGGEEALLTTWPLFHHLELELRCKICKKSKQRFLFIFSSGDAVSLSIVKYWT